VWNWWRVVSCYLFLSNSILLFFLLEYCVTVLFFKSVAFSQYLFLPFTYRRRVFKMYRTGGDEKELNEEHTILIRWWASANWLLKQKNCPTSTTNLFFKIILLISLLSNKPILYYYFKISALTYDEYQLVFWWCFIVVRNFLTMIVIIDIFCVYVNCIVKICTNKVSLCLHWEYRNSLWRIVIYLYIYRSTLRDMHF